MNNDYIACLLRYYSIRIDIDHFYPQYPMKPFWINKLTTDLLKLQQKRLPLDESIIYELFKEYSGYKKATKNKVRMCILNILQYFQVAILDSSNWFKS